MSAHLEVIDELTPSQCDHVVVYLPKSKARWQMLLDLAGASLTPEGKLWLVGAKKAGIASAGKHLGQQFAYCKKVDAARHCMLFEAHQPLQPQSFDEESYWQHHDSGTLTLFSLPGVFSHGRLDDASALLLDHLPAEMPGHCLDFGCGCGVLSAAAARRGATVTAVDVDLLAVRSCAKTLTENGLEGTVLGANGIAEQPGPYRWIISNPPFHQGVNQDLSVTHKMLDDAARVMASDGELWLVANRFLDYPSRLAQRFTQVEEIAGNRSFRVIRATQPR